jgi:hypothetical protein
LTGSPGSIPILKKNQNDVIFFLKKSTGCNQVFDRVLPGQPAGSHRVMTFSIFFSTQPGSSPGSAEFQVNPLGRISKLCKKASFPTNTDLNHHQLLHHRGRLGEGGL